MSGELKFNFEELPIIVDLGFEAGLVNGTATIGYEDGGEYFVREIALDGHRRRSIAERAESQAKGRAFPMFERKSVIVDRASYSWLYVAICDQLENGRFKNHVVDAIEADRAASRHDAADDRRDQLRDERAEHSTTNRSQQGT